MRLLILGLVITAFFFLALSGCGDDGTSADYDAGTDSDVDTDTDTDGVPIEHPEAINHFMNPNGLMTGPISPPPENMLGGESEDGPPSPDPTLEGELDDEEVDEEELEDVAIDDGELGEEL